MTRFDHAITIITSRVYDESPSIDRLMHSMAGAAFLFGLEMHFGDEDLLPDLLEHDTAHEAVEGLDPMIDAFLAKFVSEECQIAIESEATCEGLPRIDSCVALVVTSYVDHHARGRTAEELEGDRLHHAVGVTTWSLRTSLRLAIHDEELARVFWIEACETRAGR
tara:strand:+ start:1945 stop:2439 length:495 start_codon:yes stop_codon:yes gene_type:complete